VSDFEAKRNAHCRTQELRANLVNQGEKILERKLGISNDEEVYYSNKRIFTNLGKLS
jgi:hypothetical protein